MYQNDEVSKEVRSAFREAEKRYQQHWQQSFRYRKGRRQGSKLLAVPTDLSDVRDSRSPAQNFTKSITADGRPFLTLPSHPGFILLPEALGKSKQRELAKLALTQYPEPPANTNHTRQFGKLTGLWDAAQKGLHLEAGGQLNTFQGDQQVKIKRYYHAEPPLTGQGQWVDHAGGPSAQKLLQKLRWCTLGPQFNWTERVYDWHAPYRPLPMELRDLAISLCASVSGSLPETVAASDWDPDVALINYYRSGDTLGGHKDDVEQDQAAPIVALSLGCSAIFLLGGQTKEEQPIAIRLHGGDVVIMAGPARMCYHGVPRVLGDDASSSDANPEDAEYVAFAEHVRSTRINISIRKAG